MELTFLVVAALGWAGGRHPLEQVALAGAVMFPVPGALLGLALGLRQVRGRRGSDRRSAGVLLLVRLAAQLRSGSTLHSAVGEIAAGQAELAAAARLATAGRPMPQVVEALRPGLGRFAELTAASIRMASRSGGALAPVVEQLVVQAMALDDIQRERRAAMAPGLLQAGIVGGIPVVVLGSMAVSGRLLDLLSAGPFHAAAALIGSLLVTAGVGVVARVAMSDRR